MLKRTPFTLHCRACGSTNIKADADAVWCPDTQAWELCAVFDARYCDECGHENDVEERPILNAGADA